MSPASPELSARAVRDAAPLFAALGDETRLRLVLRLATERGSIARLCDGSGISRQAITKHLEVLADAKLVRSHRQGRERIWELDRQRLEEAEAVLDRIGRRWEQALGRLKAFVER